MLLSALAGVARGADFTVSINKLTLSLQCRFIDSDNNEEWGFGYTLGGQTTCYPFVTTDATPWTTASGFLLTGDFTSNTGEHRMPMTLLEKSASSGSMCEFAVGDNTNSYVRWEQVFSGLATLDDDDEMTWSVTKTLSPSGCSLTVDGTVERKPIPGTPRIKKASFSLLESHALQLKIEGFDLNPDPQEAPSMQITGIRGVECIASTVVLSDREYKCQVTNPPSDEVARIEAQVQVQTRLGISRTATVSFPACNPACQNNAPCWWYTNSGTLECECPLEYYGASCQNRYPDDQPILSGLAPIGVDVTVSVEQPTLFAVSGRVWPPSSSSSTITPVCVITWDVGTVKLAADGQSIETDSNIVWSGPVQPMGSQTIPYASTLGSTTNAMGVCVVPANSFNRANSEEKHLEPPRRVFVKIAWVSSATGKTIHHSQDELEFLLYGAINPVKSLVSMEVNQADGEIRVFRKQSVFVSFLDDRGRSRAGSEDADLFSLSFFEGPSLQPQVGIQGGIAKHFHFEYCLTNSIDPECSYYELEVSFDLSGVYLAQVFYFAPGDTTLIKMGDVLRFEVRGFGEVTLPVPPPLASSIAWADHLTDEELPLFDTALSQTLSPNTGAADRSKVLDPLFKRWQGRWFSQRQTVSLAFESAISKATFGSIHVVRGQGLDDEPQFCDAHFDVLEDGPLMQSLKPWHRMDSVPNKFALTRMAVSQSDCVTGIAISVVFVHSNPNNVRITLKRSGPASAAHRARNLISSVVLKDYTDSIGIWTTVQFTQTTTGALASFVGRPALAEWVLEVEQQGSGTGFIMDWWIDVETQPCLSMPNAQEGTICGTGGGEIYARAKSVNDTVHLECPFGSVISEIVWARYGRIEGSCADGESSLIVHDECQADPSLVLQRVASQCPVGYSWCDINAVDDRFGAQPGEPLLCAGEEPPCAKRRSLLPLGGNDYMSERREHHEAAVTQPWSYPGTEDHYMKDSVVRHATEPFFRPRSNADRQGSSSGTCSDTPTHPKKALIVQARCSETRGAFNHTDDPVVDKVMLMASASADLDNDYKDETVTLFGYAGGALHVAFTYVGSGTGPTTFVVRNLVVGAASSPVKLGGQLKVQAGDFDNDGYPELVFGFMNTAGALKLYRWDLNIQSTSVWGSLAKLARTNVQPCGCFSSEYESVLRSLFASAILITVPDAPTVPLLVNTERLDSPGFVYALAAGDVGFVGYDVLAVTWIVSKSSVAWGLFRETPGGAFGLVTSQPMFLRTIEEPNAVSIALGNFEGKGAFELALAISAYNDVNVYLYDIDQTSAEYEMTQAQIIPISDAPWHENVNVNLVMVAGDINDDGDHEIVVGYTFQGQARLFQLDAVRCEKLECMELIGPGYVISTGATLAGSTRSAEMKLAIGNVDDSYVNEIVVALEYRSTLNNHQDVKVMLLALNAQSDPNRAFVIKGRHCYSSPSYRQGEELGEATVNNMALTVGNLYGLGFRVGEPRTVRYESVPELIAVINAPPAHYDVVNDGEEVVVNPKTFGGYGSFTKLSEGKGVMSSFEVSTKQMDFDVQSGNFGFDMHVAIIARSLNYREKKFSRSGSVVSMAKGETVVVSRELTASGDDVVLYVSTTKDRWSYPIVDQNEVEVGALEIWLSSSCGEQCVQVADGRDLWWFTPDHEPFNMLTYSSRAPNDFSPAARIMVGDRVTMGPNEHHQTVAQESSLSQSAVKFDESGADWGVGGYSGFQFDYEYTESHAFLGLGPQHRMPLGVHVGIGGGGDTEKGTETENHPDSKSAALSRTVEVSTYLEAISPEFAYRVQSFVWMARGVGGKPYLKVDYCAEPGYQAGVSTWWQRTYNKPDPAFNLPWWWTTFKRDRTMLTKEMFSTPSFPNVGDTVEVTVTVRNKALVSASNVRVTLWRGNPDNCFSLDCLLETDTLIGASTINMIPAQSKREVSFLFSYDGVQNIHATLDDNNEIEETHEDNNHAYALLFHNKREAGFTLQTLRLDKQITLAPLMNNNAFAGGYNVSVTVLGDAFTYKNVIVQLWHGAVGVSGRLIATLGIPIVYGSVTTQTRHRVTAYWEVKNPHLYGQQELHAVILHSGFETTPENIISHVSRRVTVACYGEVDQCGVCGGRNRSCAGCDEVPFSGAVVDMCGVCGGDNSTCCVPKPALAKLHRIRLRGADSDDSQEFQAMVRRVKVGDLVVWENLLDWDVEIKSGALESSESYAAKAFELSALRNNDQALPGGQSLPVSNEDVDAYVQAYMSMVVMKDQVEPATLSQGKIEIPTPDTTNQYLRRRQSTKENSASSAEIWLATKAGGFERRAEAGLLRRDYMNINEETDQDDYRGEEEAGLVEQFDMSGVCCGPEAFSDNDDDGDDNDGEVFEIPSASSGGSGVARSLRSVVLSKLREHKRALVRRGAITNITIASASTDGYAAFYNPELRAANASEIEANALGQRIRCLCPSRASGSDSPRTKRMFGCCGRKATAAVRPTAMAVEEAPAVARVEEAMDPAYIRGAGAFPTRSSAGMDSIEAIPGSGAFTTRSSAGMDSIETIPASRASSISGSEDYSHARGFYFIKSAEMKEERQNRIDDSLAREALGMPPLDDSSDYGGPDDEPVRPVETANDEYEHLGALSVEDMFKELRTQVRLINDGWKDWRMDDIVRDVLYKHDLKTSLDLLRMAVTSKSRSLEKFFQALPGFRGRRGPSPLLDPAKRRKYLLELRERMEKLRSRSTGAADETDVSDSPASSTLQESAAEVAGPMAAVRRQTTTSSTTRQAPGAGGESGSNGGKSVKPIVSAGGSGRDQATAGSSLWGMFDFSSISQATQKADGPGVLMAGEASMPHRFFRPGVYLWHDARHPAIHGALVVEPSDLVVDECGVCGGDNTECLDCMLELNGPHVWDACGQCVDPTAANYAPDSRIDCAGKCDGAAITACGMCVHDINDAYDCNGECGGTAKYDCAQVCGGSLIEDCAGECGGSAVENGNGDCIARRATTTATAADDVGDSPSSSTDDGDDYCRGVKDAKGMCCASVSELDCAGVCKGTSRVNPCGVCALPEAMARGENYWVDCANTCNGRATVDECGVCVGGVTGLSMGAHKDCAGVCFGNSTLDECGVCYDAAETDIPHLSGMDCAGVCGGKAVVDDCGMCVEGTTRRTFNHAKDCAGQCFGDRAPNDPACRCPKGQLDACFVCHGDGSLCAGCDGMPNSGARPDLCGVCNGDSSTCCFLAVPQATVHIRGGGADALLQSHPSLDAGEALAVFNLHAGHAYTLVLVRLDSATSSAAMRGLGVVQAGHKLSVTIGEPGEYELTAMESASVAVRISVRYNAKKIDPRAAATAVRRQLDQPDEPAAVYGVDHDHHGGLRDAHGGGVDGGDRHRHQQVAQQSRRRPRADDVIRCYERHPQQVVGAYNTHTHAQQAACRAIRDDA